jgi:hypothetical protein
MSRCLVALAACPAAAFAAPPAYHAAVAADNPILWYQFNEPAGSATAINYGTLGTPYDGAYLNGAAPGAATSSGDTGVSFNAAAQQYVESAAVAPASMLGNPTFTAETVVAITPGTASDYAPFLHWGAAATGESVFFSLWLGAGDRIFAGFYNGGLRSVCAFPHVTWLHVVWVRDSAGGANGQWAGTTLYINGSPVATEHDDVLVGAPVINITPTTFRVQRSTDRSRYFGGTMDEVALFPVALTPEQVRAHYQALALPACGADFDGQCGVNVADFLAFLAAFAAADPRCDINHDARIDVRDFLAFLQAFANGC